MFVQYSDNSNLLLLLIYVYKISTLLFLVFDKYCENKLNLLIPSNGKFT